MKPQRLLYYSLSFSLSALSLIYCVLVYLAGQHMELEIGSHYLVSIPNYYFFYTVILPFVATGVIYLACENRFIRFFGGVSEELSDDHRKKVRRYQKILPFFCLLFSMLVIVQDAAEKNFTLPPYAFNFASETQAQAVAEFYACAKGWKECDPQPTEQGPEQYLSVLQANGLSTESVTGFATLSQWWTGATWLYRFESLLSFLGALIVSFFIAEIFLLMIVKNYTKPATRNLIIWMLILTSFWFPTKIYSAWNFTLGLFKAPVIFLFGLLVLALGVLLVFFIKSERNELAKYGALIAALFSFALGSVSYLKPEFIHEGVELMREFGLIYVSIFAALVLFSLYLVTDYFINSYEEEILGSN